MRSAGAISWTAFRDALRRKVVWIVLLASGLLALVIPSLPSYGQGVVESVYREVAIALMYVTGLVVTLGLAATRIPGEVERRTVYAVLSHDVSRTQYVAGTWLGIFGVIGVVLAGFSAVVIGAGLVVYGSVMPQTLEASFAVWLELGIVAAVVLLLSTRFGPVTSVAGALVFLFAGHTLAGVLFPAGAPGWFPSLDVFDVVNPVAHGTGYGLGHGLAMTAVFAAWVALLLAGAAGLFAPRDL